MSSPVCITLDAWADRRGKLVAVEKLPFDIKRAFWLYDLKDWRGGHAHKKCEQLLVAMHGEVWVEAGDWEGYLSDPEEGLYVPPGNHVDLYGKEAVILVLCSEYYDSEDYVYFVR